MEDKEIVDLYWARSEMAISETSKKYGRYCHYIAFQILSDDLDAEEIVNDTYLKTWNAIPPKRPTVLKGFVGMICRQLSLNAYEAKHAKKRSGQVPLALEELQECIPDNDSGTDLGESMLLRDVLNRFVRSLPRQTQEIFVRRYWYVCSVTNIAKDYRMTENHVNVLLFRARKKLKQMLNDEGVFI